MEPLLMKNFKCREYSVKVQRLSGCVLLLALAKTISNTCRVNCRSSSSETLPGKRETDMYETC